MRYTALIVALVATIGLSVADDGFAPVCDSPIYCTGEILHTIQMARLNVDSKTFVDMKLKAPPADTVESFRLWKLDNPTPSDDSVRQFVADNFDKEGSEFQDWVPSDHTPNPVFLDDIKDPEYRRWATNLNDFWLRLGRNMSQDVVDNSELYSIIHVPNPVIVPGGRFREFYYWDSYWIMLGLLHSEMFTTVRGMLGNYVSIVDRFGFIPNGGRIYYMGRSQPPLLIPMVHEYLRATGDLDFVRENIESLEREYAYWFNDQKAVQVKGYTLSTYTDRAPGPRPESYWEDRSYGQRFWDKSSEYELYAEMRAAAESGMDFSTRWYLRHGTNNGTLLDLKTRSFAPVELNSILYWNAKLLSEFYEKLGNGEKAFEYRRKATLLFRAIEDVFWDESVGTWLDWDLVNNIRRNYFVPTNLAPLWVGAYHRRDTRRLAQKTLSYVHRLHLDTFAAAVPNTLVESGEQWDYPNGWAPMQHMMIVGLANLGTPETEALALKWADKWVYTNYVAYNRTGFMYEKYSANVIGLGGRGGEYAVQLGFGWSNGVILDLLHKYGGQLESLREALF